MLLIVKNVTFGFVYCIINKFKFVANK